MEMTSETKKIQSRVNTTISVKKKRRETKAERNDERDVFQVFSRNCGAESANELVL
jgi:hypothetical protein